MKITGFVDRGQMLVASVIIITALLVSTTSSLPSSKDGYAKIRAKIMGRPDPSVGIKVAKWKPGDGNPSELGSYFEGDILLPSHLTRNGLSQTAYRWPKGEIPYVINGTFNSSELAVINKAMSAYHENTCIKFRPATDSDVDYISIESSTTGCWSYLGRRGGKQALNLQTPGCVYYVGTAIHEFMHTAGFYHEQSRTDRDSYVTINWNNISPGYENNFNIASGTITFGTTYDYGSVLHYSANAFSSNGEPTITVPAGITIGQRQGFSTTDIQKLRSMYMCNGTTSLL